MSVAGAYRVLARLRAAMDRVARIETLAPQDVDRMRGDLRQLEEATHDLTDSPLPVLEVLHEHSEVLDASLVVLNETAEKLEKLAGEHGV